MATSHIDDPYCILCGWRTSDERNHQLALRIHKKCPRCGGSLLKESSPPPAKLEEVKPFEWTDRKRPGPAPGSKRNIW